MFKSSVNKEWMVQKERKADSVEEKWLAFKNVVLRCAKSACGVKLLNKCGIRTGCEWWNAEVERLVKVGISEMAADCRVKVEMRMKGINL